MTHAAAVSILALTVGLSLTRPRVGRVRISPASAAVGGAVLTLLLGLLPASGVAGAARILAGPIITIIGLMVITVVADLAGLFRLLAWQVARAAKGDGRRLFTYIFFAGTLCGAVFTNDAAVLIFTPMVYRLVEEIKEDSWTFANKLPYYFGVLYVANLATPLVIGNPINIVVASWFDIRFLEYARWMAFPALVSVVVTYVGLRLFFARHIPRTYRVPTSGPGVSNPFFVAVCGIVLGFTLAGFFTEHLTHIPSPAVAILGAAALVLLYMAFQRSSLKPVVRGIGWDVIIFVSGIFIVARGLSNVGLTAALGNIIGGAEGASPLSVAFTAGTCSAIMNNHPVADIMAMVITDLRAPFVETRLLAFSALIGGDLGPKMLPIGSLAALLWFRILRDKGVDVSYWLYIKLGVPVTLAAILLSVLALNLQYAIFY